MTSRAWVNGCERRPAVPVAGVVVDAEEIQGALRGGRVLLESPGQEAAAPLQDDLGVGAPEIGIEVEPVSAPVHEPRRRPVGRARRVGGIHPPQVVRDADRGAAHEGAQDAGGPVVRHQEVVRGTEHAPQVVPPPRRVLARPVPEGGVHQRLVHGDPALHPVAERAGDGLGEAFEVIGRLPYRETAEPLEPGRRFPMEERQPGLDARREQPVDETVVEGETRGVEASRFGEHAVPRRGEPVGAQAQVAHQRDVLPPAPVVVAGQRPRCCRRGSCRAGGRTRATARARRRRRAASPRSGRRTWRRPRRSRAGMRCALPLTTATGPGSRRRTRRRRGGGRRGTTRSISASWPGETSSAGSRHQRPGEQALPLEHRVHAGDAAPVRVGDVEDRGVHVRHLDADPEDLDGHGPAEPDHGLDPVEQLHGGLRPARPVAEQAAPETHLDAPPAGREDERGDEVGDDGVVVARVEGHLVLPAALRERPHARRGCGTG